ncbi:MAG: amidohydrolase family protein [Planctomycetota bacterium]
MNSQSTMKTTCLEYLNKIRSLASLGSTLLAVAFAHLALASDQIPGAPQTKPILIQNAVLHTVSNGTLVNHCILLKDGKIAQIEPVIAPQDGYEVIDAQGKHVYPGLFDSLSYLGLVEVDSINASVDNAEVGSLNPNVKAPAAFNPDSEAIPVARANGVLFSLVSPTGGLVSGRAAVMQLDGWTWEDMTVKADTAMTVQWPRFGGAQGRARGPRGQRDAESGESENSDRLNPLHEIIRETRAYIKAKASDPTTSIDLRLEAMIPIIEGKIPVMIVANSLKQIQTAVAFCQLHGLKMILYGGADAAHCGQLLKDANIPVILSAVYRLPSRRDAPYDSMYALPAKLQAEGIRFSISSEGRFGASGVRNLPYNAAAACGFGLDPEIALRSITLSPAEIFGLADRVGSLQAGKDASIFISDGDILETATQVQHAWIQGRKVDLSSKHTDLYEKYKTKYQRLK